MGSALFDAVSSHTCNNNPTTIINPSEGNENMPTTATVITDDYGPASVVTQAEFSVTRTYLETTLKFQTNDGGAVTTLDFSFFGDVHTASERDELVESIAAERVALDTFVNEVLRFQRAFNEIANRALKEVRL